jgi:hypothetical protein
MEEEWDPKRWAAGRVAWEGALEALRRRAGTTSAPIKAPSRSPKTRAAEIASASRPALLHRPTTAA